MDIKYNGIFLERHNEMSMIRLPLLCAVCGTSFAMEPFDVRKEIHGLNFDKDRIVTSGWIMVAESGYNYGYHPYCFEIKKACKEKRILILEDRKEIGENNGSL